MSAKTRGGRVLARSRPGPTDRASPATRATHAPSRTLTDTTTLPPSDNSSGDDINLSDHESASSVGDRDQRPTKKSRRRTKSKKRRQTSVEGEAQIDKSLPPLERALRESPATVKHIYLPA